ncbi:precorrin-3B synthase [Nonomuraea jiangxiensis]|uniref:Precorrin-3B synthase n=1 Tax=Nonomuraea jiangxiensis TaxID=633440 RepID=A0A1G9G0H1_9ACTN|nr:precorrin-3B synthase [Nonomuraea jiangxiensis]
MHEAADGPLARVRLPGGAISPAQLRELAACAEELGGGVIELTSRANVQVRALRSPAAFAGRIAAAGLLPSAAHERVRNIVASPLGGRGPAGLLDPAPLVAALDRALCALPRLAGLPGRFLFAVDDGTGDMPGLGADVTFVPSAPETPVARPEGTAGGPGDGGAVGRLLLAGADAGIVVRAEVAVQVMVAAAAAFLDEREATPGERAAWRIEELTDGPARITARLTTADPTADPTSGPPISPGPSPPQHAGRIGQRDGRVALEVVAPLGRLSAAQARALATVASGTDGECAAQERAAGRVSDPATDVPVRLTPWRTVMFLDLSPEAAGRAERTLAEAGLVTDPASPWVGVSACTGRPGCAKARADVQQDARRWVAELDGPAPDPVHWAGCERRCGLPRGRVVQLTATGDGYRRTTTAGRDGGQHPIATQERLQ